MAKLQHGHQRFIIFLLIVAYYDQVTGVNCPSPASISPCLCLPYYYSSQFLEPSPIQNAVEIKCSNLNLNDLQMSNVLSAFSNSSAFLSVYKISGDNNQLTRFPNQVSGFPTLSILDLSGNHISELPLNDRPFIWNRLTNRSIEISLGFNEITQIPPFVFNFPLASKVYISMWNNRIDSISPDAFRLPSAKTVVIQLGSNQISVIPEGIYKLPNALRAEIFLNSNKIVAIPSGAFNLPQVSQVIVKLDRNQITSIPSDTFNFPSDVQAVGLEFSMNKISQIPCGRFSYPFAYQVRIDLNNNQIAAVPSCAFNFPSTQYVEVLLASNIITSISSGVFNFPSATHIVLLLKNNKISTIPPNTFGQGHYWNLELQNNQLKRFDSEVFKFPLINFNFDGKPYTTLDITGNPIDCSTDPCHLAWLFKSNKSSDMLNVISGYNVCSNRPSNDLTAPPFSALQSFDFNRNCGCYYN